MSSADYFDAEADLLAKDNWRGPRRLREAAIRIRHLESALGLALRYLDEGPLPSDEFVSMTMVECNLTNMEALDIIEKASKKWDDNPPERNNQIEITFD